MLLPHPRRAATTPPPHTSTQNQLRRSGARASPSLRCWLTLLQQICDSLQTPDPNRVYGALYALRAARARQLRVGGVINQPPTTKKAAAAGAGTTSGDEAATDVL